MGVCELCIKNLKDLYWWDKTGKRSLLLFLAGQVSHVSEKALLGLSVLELMLGKENLKRC